MAKSDNSLRLDKANGKFLGVCAGLGNYTGVEAMKIRLVFVVCALFGGWFLIPMYFVVWFLLDDSSVSMRQTVAENQFVRHFRTVDYRKKLYRNTRDRKILGVCAGIADYLEVSVFAVRLVFLLLFFMTGFPLLFYIGAALVLDKRPWYEFDDQRTAAQKADTGGDIPAGSASGRERTKGQRAPHYGPRDIHTEQLSKRREFQYCARKFAALQQRLARMEAYVTSSRFRLHREFRNIS